MQPLPPLQPARCTNLVDEESSLGTVVATGTDGCGVGLTPSLRHGFPVPQLSLGTRCCVAAPGLFCCNVVPGCVTKSTSYLSVKGENEPMFNPGNLDALRNWGDVDLCNLPATKDERHEYKSSATADVELAKKIGRAASAFWNSGGGLFVAGVDGRGQADGGIEQTVGRQSRRDWIDRVIGAISPQGKYVVHSVEDRGAGLKIAAGKAVYLIGFADSEVGPHMAPDNKYYIRGGAHTVPAGHFIVEAIHARRGMKRPILRSILRRKPESGGII
jgi:hypothetical protein